MSGVATKQILTNQLSSTPVATTTAKGIAVTVTGVNFQILTSDVLTITIALQKSNSLLQQNSTGTDNFLVVVSQCSVQLTND